MTKERLKQLNDLFDATTKQEEEAAWMNLFENDLTEEELKELTKGSPLQ